jgi:hypothetical protein
MKFYVDYDTPSYHAKTYGGRYSKDGYQKINHAISFMHTGNGVNIFCYRLSIVNRHGSASTMLLKQHQRGIYSARKTRTCLQISDLMFIKKSFVRKTSVRRKPKRITAKIKTTTETLEETEKEFANIYWSSTELFDKTTSKKKKKAIKKKWKRAKPRRRRPNSG